MDTLSQLRIWVNPTGAADSVSATFRNGRCRSANDRTSFEPYTATSRDRRTDFNGIIAATALLGKYDSSDEGMQDIVRWRDGVWTELIALHRTGLKRGALLPQQRVLLMTRFHAEVSRLCGGEVHAERARRYAEGAWFVFRAMRSEIHAPDIADAVTFLQINVLRDEIARFVRSQSRARKRGLNLAGVAA